MSIAYTLQEKNKINGWEPAEAAIIAKIDFERYLAILQGSIKPSYDEALKLTKAYKIPSAFFFSEPSNATHLNSAEGTYSNSNHGYIYSVTNNTDSGLKDLVKELITIIKPDIIWPNNKRNSKTVKK